MGDAQAPFEPNKRMFRLVPSEYTQRECRHSPITVNRAKRRITCRSCGSVVEPFDWIAALVERHEVMENEWKRLVQQREVAGAELEELRRRERNAKARVRKWENKARVLERRPGVDSEVRP